MKLIKAIQNPRLAGLVLEHKAVAAIDKWFPATEEQLISVLPFTRNSRRLLALKDRHQGERCFIIGTGPSLLVEDLDRLVNEITFASNKIFLAFDQTRWRPTYYSVFDILVAQQNKKQIKELELNKIMSLPMLPSLDQSEVIWVYTRATEEQVDKPTAHFSTNLLRGLYGGRTVIIAQLQLAYYMGIREVYLLGVDFHFNISKPTGEESMHGLVLESQGEKNHFHPEYRKAGEKWTIPRLDHQYKAFGRAKTAFEKQGGTIYNASRQTALDLFPRIDFEAIVF